MASRANILARNPYAWSQKSAAKIGWVISLIDRHLRYPFAAGGYPQGAQTAVCFGYNDAAHGLGSVGFIFQVLDQLPQKRFYPRFLFMASKLNPSMPAASESGL